MLPNNVFTEEQFTWYEASLPLMERKRRGHFSTPPLLVEKILDACGYIPDNDLTHVRVLDPACGSGNFLTEAGKRLLTFGARASLSLDERASLLQCNLWGFDPDPISCFLAEMKLHTIIHNNISHSIKRSPFHIHQADSLLLPWEPCIDLFITNPPYLAAKNNDLSGYRFVQQRGQTDSYLLFLNLALQIVRPGGWIGLVLPDSLLARANAARERARLLKEATLHHLWHFSDVFAADVGAVVIIAQKTSPGSMHTISWIRGRWQANATATGASEHQVQQSLFSRQPAAEFRYLLNQGRGTPLEQLRICLEETSGSVGSLAPLGEYLTISRGEELGRDNPSIRQCIPSQLNTSIPSTTICRDDPGDRLTGGRSGCDVGEQVFPKSNRDAYNHNCHQFTLLANYPVLRGGIDIHPYCMPMTDCSMTRQAITKPLERYLSPKLLVVKSTNRLQAALDLKGHIALQTLYLLHLRNQHESFDQLYFFLALLNSRLLREYVYVLHTAYKWVQPQIEQRVLDTLPVPIVELDRQQPIIQRAKALERACSLAGSVVEWNQDISNLYEEQELAICALYDAVLPGYFIDKGVIKND
jgi:hypothetical protein